MNFYKPFELFYYDAANKEKSRCVENFASMKELLEREEEIKRKSKKRKIVFEHYMGGSK